MGSDCLPQCLFLCLHCLPLCLQLSQSNKLKKNKACINYPKQNEIKTYTEHQKKGTKMKAKTSVMVKTIASECTSLHNIKWPVLAFNLRGITISCVWHQCNQALLKLGSCVKCSLTRCWLKLFSKTTIDPSKEKKKDGKESPR